VVGDDEIVVLDAGRIAEQGRHDELLQRGGQYARMWASYTAVQANEWEVAQ
jgi:ATP-binding cassette, subfamily B, bacterial IrtA/YbtP